MRQLQGDKAAAQQQAAELEASNAACLQELDAAAASLTASEQRLSGLLGLQLQYDTLQEAQEMLQAQLEQSEQDKAALQQKVQSLEELRASQADASQAQSCEQAAEQQQLVHHLQKQLAAAAIELQAARQQQDAAEQQLRLLQRQLHACKAEAAQLATSLEQQEQLLQQERAAASVSKQQQTPQDAAATAAIKAELGRLQQRCAMLDMRVAEQQQALADADTRQARLHALNAQLQERLSVAAHVHDGDDEDGSPGAWAEEECQRLSDRLQEAEDRLEQQQEAATRQQEEETALLRQQVADLQAQLTVAGRQQHRQHQLEVEVSLPDPGAQVTALHERCTMLSSQVAALEERLQHSQSSRAADGQASNAEHLQALQQQCNKQAQELKHWQEHAQVR